MPFSNVQILFMLPSKYMSILFISLLVLGFSVQAQTNKATIKGLVKDTASNKILSFATVGLYKVNEEKPIKNIFTGSKGEFVLQGVDTGNYTITISNTGYVNKTSNIIIIKANETIDVGTFLMMAEPKDLAAVLVSSNRKPLLERSEDKLIFNAEADPTLDGQQATDVLRKTPFLSVDNDGNVTLNGQKNFKILLNGKESSMFAKDPKEVLKAFPASLIKKIEVSTQPSAKYDAEGIGGIINIITKKKVVGYNGSIGYSLNTIGFWNLNTNFNAKYGKLGFSGYFGKGGNGSPTGNSESVTTSLQPIAYRERRLIGTSYNGFTFQNGNLELSYDVDSLNTISTYANIGGGKNNHLYYQQQYLIKPAGDTAKGTLNTINYNKYPELDLGIDYIKKFKSNPDKEFTLRFNSNIGKTDGDYSSDQLQQGFQRYTLSNSNAHDNQYTLQADMVLPLKNKQKIEFGAKGVLRRAYSDYESAITYSPNSKFVTDSANTNVFNYNQNVFGLYTSYGFNYKKLFFKLGIRGEFSSLGGAFETAKTTVHQHYFNLVPTLYISKNLANNQTINISYNIRLQRPYIGDLNPFINNADSLSISYGNPNLKPQLIHNLEFGYSLFKGANSANIKTSFFYSNNQITQYSNFNNNTGITYSTSDNIGRNYGTSLSAFLSLKPVKWISINGNIGLKYDFIINKLNPNIRNQGLSGWGNLNALFDFNKQSGISFYSGMNKQSVSLQEKPGIFYWYGAGFFYKFFNNKIRVAIRCDNFLESQIKYKSTSSGDNFTAYQNIYSPGRALGVSLRWNFGKLTDNVSKKRGITTDDVKK